MCLDRSKVLQGIQLDGLNRDCHVNVVIECGEIQELDLDL